MSHVSPLPKSNSTNSRPQIIFFPDNVYQSIQLAFEKPDVIFDLKQALSILGTRQLGLIVYINSLYNSDENIFLTSEHIKGLESLDLIDMYRDQITVMSDTDVMWSGKYDDMIRSIDGFKLAPPTLPEFYIKPEASNDIESKQYYVPVLFTLREKVYGVRLVAVTDLSEERQITVANIELLSKQYPLKTIAGFEYFNKFIELC